MTANPLNINVLVQIKVTSWLALAAGRKLRELVTTSAVLTEALLVYSDVFVKGSDLCQLLMSSVGVMCQRLN